MLDTRLPSCLLSWRALALLAVVGCLVVVAMRGFIFQHHLRSGTPPPHHSILRVCVCVFFSHLLVLAGTQHENDVQLAAAAVHRICGPSGLGRRLDGTINFGVLCTLARAKRRNTRVCRCHCWGLCIFIFAGVGVGFCVLLVAPVLRVLFVSPATAFSGVLSEKESVLSLWRRQLPVVYWSRQARNAPAIVSQSLCASGKTTKGIMLNKVPIDGRSRSTRATNGQYTIVHRHPIDIVRLQNY